MTLINENSNTNIRYCIDPRKDDSYFPCGWMTYDKKCKWKGELVCKPIRIDWYIERNIDNLKDLEL